MAKKSVKIIAQNKKAYHDYFILETIQAGIELQGTEVKSMRAGRCNLKDSYISITNKEAFIKGMHISPFEQGNRFNHDPLRERRLLLHKYEINKLEGRTMQQGLTIVPLKVYFEGSLVKMDIGLAKGKKLYDKRQDIAKRDQKREAEKDFKLNLQT
ncbi:MAG: SsrA-binding protein SmpB [Clostridiales bacterium]|nr:SsrA-binding protein SmpB [Clostridiales bacterium]MCD8238709.1 SsrA-binding protein SmpB [Clostridiales bacterium]